MPVFLYDYTELRTTYCHKTKLYLTSLGLVGYQVTQRSNVRTRDPDLEKVHLTRLKVRQADTVVAGHLALTIIAAWVQEIGFKVTPKM